MRMISSDTIQEHFIGMVVWIPQVGMKVFVGESGVFSLLSPDTKIIEMLSTLGLTHIP